MASSSPVAEYMKIRRYVMNLIHRTQGRSVKIPTTKELSQKFGVSRQTVGKAMKQLTQDGYIIGRPGIGSFTNPTRTEHAPSASRIPIIGIIISDGRCVHFDEYIGKIFAALLNEVVMLPATIHTLYLDTSDPDLIYQELINEELDGLVWSNPYAYQHDVIRRLVESGLPVVTSGILIEGVSGVRFDYEEMGYQCGKMLIDELRKNVVFLGDTSPWNLPATGIRRAYSEVGIDLNERLFLKDRNTILEKLKMIVDLGMPIDAVYNPFYLYNDVQNILRDAGIDLKHDCRLLCSNIIAAHDPDFHGIIHHFDFPAKAAEVSRLLRLAMNDKSSVLHSKLPLQISAID